MSVVNRIIPCLWFDDQAEEAAKFYTSIFKNSRITKTSYYGEEGYEFHKKKSGTVMVVTFEIEGQQYNALNGGPQFKFSEAVSLQVMCDNQAEIDYYWEKLTQGGEEGPCGWLKDKFGFSWQVIPLILEEMLLDPDINKRERVMKAYLQMKKYDISLLKKAFEGR
ncbi:MAG: VOC family protein [Sporocytophaga sp.]|uniref:VOC family protein n=1 Tax=Sporocytophaga sp. TaxID=2231183 RepID=UPI001B0C62AB|nr:VOC family protein [Sporocytophaga sp.]MBO9698866.1 VOC family protein [Sporocytophaga sp.]